MAQRIIVDINDPNPVLQTVGINNNITTATIVCREHCQHEQDPDVNCHIDSLEVYRGRERTTKIGQNHGFSITNNGTITVSIIFQYSSVAIGLITLIYYQINRKNVSNVEELQGELYRMNLSCPQIGRGCVFFKIAGVANVTHG